MTSKEKILEIIFNNPTAKFHIRELARQSGLNPNTVSSIITDLQKEKIVISEKKRYIVEISVNLTSIEYIRKKRGWNFNKIYSSGLIDYLLKHFSRDNIPYIKSVSVIGSYSQGEDIEKSDIDIVIISDESSKEIPDVSLFEKRLKRKIHLIATDFRKISEEFYVNLINGMLMYGYLTKR